MAGVSGGLADSNRLSVNEEGNVYCCVVLTVEMTVILLSSSISITNSTALMYVKLVDIQFLNLYSLTQSPKCVYCI